MCALTHTCTHTHSIHRHTQTHVHTYLHTHTHTCTHTQTHTHGYMHVCMDKDTHRHMQTHMLIRLMCACHFCCILSLLPFTIILELLIMVMTSYLNMLVVWNMICARIEIPAYVTQTIFEFKKSGQTICVLS